MSSQFGQVINKVSRRSLSLIPGSTEASPEGQGYFVDIGALGTSKDMGHLGGSRTCDGMTSRDVPQCRCGVNFADKISVSWEVCNTRTFHKNPRQIFFVIIRVTNTH